MSDRGGVGFIGLGRMGTPMVARLHGAGYRVVGFDPDPQSARRAAAAGATIVTSAADVARTESTIILMLPSSDVVESVLGDAQTSAALGENHRIIDMGSSDPVRTRQLAAQLASSGVELIDAPVSGGVRGAETGHLTVMVGGEPGEVMTLLSVFGTVLAVGPVGSGHAIKALNNLLSATHLWATVEALAAAREFGIDPEAALAVVNSSSGKSASSERKWPDFIMSGKFDSGFLLSLMLKDVTIAVKLLAASGLDSRVAHAVLDEWSAASRSLALDADHTEVARHVDSTIAQSRGSGGPRNSTRA